MSCFQSWSTILAIKPNYVFTKVFPGIGIATQVASLKVETLDVDKKINHLPYSHIFYANLFLSVTQSDLLF